MNGLIDGFLVLSSEDDFSLLVLAMNLTGLSPDNLCAVLCKLLPNCNTLGITCYCYLKVIHYLTILLSQNCNALHYSCITFELLSPK